MTERLHIGTHKGLFELARHNGVWDIADVQFLGDPVSAVLAATDGSVYAGLDLGHFGAKLWYRNHTGNWRELPVPAFPLKPENAGDDPHPWSLGKIWVLEPGGVPGRVRAGTILADSSAPMTGRSERSALFRPIAGSSSPVQMLGRFESGSMTACPIPRSGLAFWMASPAL